MEYFELVKSRRSIRKYKAQPVNREDIMKILDAANWAPSASNRQQWEFIVVSGEWLKRLGDSYRGVVQEFTSKWDQSEGSKIISRDEFVKFATVYGGAPIAIVALTRMADDLQEQKANLESVSAAMENLVLAAADLGLGTCWLTGPLRDDYNLRLILSIPDDQEIVAVTPLGYPDQVPKPLPRIDPDLKQKIKWLE